MKSSIVLHLTFTIVIAVILASNTTCQAQSTPGIVFSKLPEITQYRIRDLTAPPAPQDRYGCYSTPMYYLMTKGYTYDGSQDQEPSKRCYSHMRDKEGPNYGIWKLDRNRPDWQEVMIRNWAELGLNNTHLNIYCENNSLILTDSYRKAIEDFVKLSVKHGLKVGVRLDALGGYVAWEMNPDNPNNQIDDYIVWVREIVNILKGQTVYYVLGDEMTLHNNDTKNIDATIDADNPDDQIATRQASKLDPKKWTPEKYLQYFKRVSAAIKSVDSNATVSMFAASSGEWFNILYLLKIGYAEYGDAVAINYYNYQDVPRFFDDAKKLAPNLIFLSNGVGYTSTATAQPRYPLGDPYSKLPTEEGHGKVIAKNMFAWWDLGAATAPYYITLRNWIKDDKIYPRWFGFFGFEDYVIDKNDHMTVKRYPGWYAFQTIAHTFYNRHQFIKPEFKVTSSTNLTMFRAYQHQLTNGSELLLMLWNDKGPTSTTITIGSDRYHYPVQISTFNYNTWTDIVHNYNETGCSITLNVDQEPLIIRLINLPTAKSN